MPAPELPDDAVVIRGGTLENRARLEASADQAHRAGDGYVLSTFAAVALPDESRADLLKRLASQAQLPHKQLRATTAGELRRRGFEVRQTGTPVCHYDVDLGTLSEERLGDFVEAFGEPEPNPACPTWRRP